MCWASGSMLFAVAGRSMGSVTLNRLRISVACVFLSIALLLTRGSPWPVWASSYQVALLAVSGLIGFVFGDRFFFKSLVILGPSRATLLVSFGPIFTVLIAWAILHEIPGHYALLGIGLTLAGVFVVMSGRAAAAPAHIEGSALAGVVAGLLGTLGQAGGYVISKVALREGLDPLSATVIRVTAALLGVWLLAAIRGEIATTVGALRDRRASAFMVGGAFLGPFLGVTLSLTALKYIQAGVAASITAVYPILTLFLASIFRHERITPRSMAGTVVAAGGIVLLFVK